MIIRTFFEKLIPRLTYRFQKYIVFPFLKFYFKNETWLISDVEITQINSNKIFQNFACQTDCSEVYSKEFSEVFLLAMKNEPFYEAKILRYRVYVACIAAQLAMRYKEGDFAFIGVSWGVTPFAISSVVNFKANDRRCYLMDCWDGSLDSSGKKRDNYCSNLEHVKRAFSDSFYKIIKGYVPDTICHIETPLCFVHLNTGDVLSEASTICLLSKYLAPQSIILIDNYDVDFNADKYNIALASLGRSVVKLCLPNGQLLAFVGEN